MAAGLIKERDSRNRATINGVPVMRRQFASLMFAGFLGVFAAQLAASPSVDEAAGTAVAAPVAVQRVNFSATGLRDEAAMVLVGTALIGLAAAIRRAA